MPKKSGKQTPSKKTPGRINPKLSEIVRSEKGNEYQSVQTMAKALAAKGRFEGMQYPELKKTLDDLNTRLNNGETTVEEFAAQQGFDVDQMEFAIFQSAIPKDDDTYDTDVYMDAHEGYMSDITSQLDNIETMVDNSTQPTMGANTVTTEASAQPVDVFTNNQENVSNSWGSSFLNSISGLFPPPQAMMTPTTAILPPPQIPSSYNTPPSMQIPASQPLHITSSIGSSSPSLGVSQLLSDSAPGASAATQVPSYRTGSLGSAPPAMNMPTLGNQTQAPARNGDAVKAGFTSDDIKRANTLGLNLSTPQGVAAYVQDRQQRASDLGRYVPGRVTDDQWTVKQRYFSRNSMNPVTRYK